MHYKEREGWDSFLSIFCFSAINVLTRQEREGKKFWHVLMNFSEGIQHFSCFNEADGDDVVFGPQK